MPALIPTEGASPGPTDVRRSDHIRDAFASGPFVAGHARRGHLQSSVSPTGRPGDFEPEGPGAGPGRNDTGRPTSAGGSAPRAATAPTTLILERLPVRIRSLAYRRWWPTALLLGASGLA